MIWDRLSIPRYNGKDGTVLLSSMGPLTILLDLFLYGERYWTEPSLLLGVSVLTFGILAGTYLLYSRLGIILRNRFPGTGNSNKRMVLALSLFLLSDFVILSMMLRGYDYFNFFEYRYQETDFVVAYCFTAILTVFLTFLNEGIARFERYKHTLRETEQLRNAYLQSQLLGLKSQVNPHFLFNSLNTLSSLIPEDAAAAEAFLDEMSKVYRYLLRNNEEYLVPLRKELSFLRSYVYLLQERHGAAFRTEIEVPDDMKDLLLPPLTLQFLFEEILEGNSFRRDAPLVVRIDASGTALRICHNQQLRQQSDRPLTGEAGLGNLREKFGLLVGRDIGIEETEGSRRITVPLIHEEQNAWNR